MKDLPKISSNRFTSSNAVCNNGCFLLEAHSEVPFLRATPGWKVVGIGKAPWPKNGDDFAVMLEKTTPEEKHGGHRGEDFAEGTRLWHHWPREQWELFTRMQEKA